MPSRARTPRSAEPVARVDGGRISRPDARSFLEKRCPRSWAPFLSTSCTTRCCIGSPNAGIARGDTAARTRSATHPCSPPYPRARRPGASRVACVGGRSQAHGLQGRADTPYLGRIAIVSVGDLPALEGAMEGVGPCAVRRPGSRRLANSPQSRYGRLEQRLTSRTQAPPQ